MFRTAGRIPFWLLRLGPALATVMTSFAVYFSGDATSGYALFYVWVGLYVFYFPISNRDAALNVVWALANYALIIAITPVDPAGRVQRGLHHFVITLGTLVTAATLLTYLRGRVEKLLGRLTDAARTDPLTGLPNRVALHEMLESELERAQARWTPGQSRRARPGSIQAGQRAPRPRRRRPGSPARVVAAGRVGAPDRLRREVREARSSRSSCPRPTQHQAFLFAEELLDKLRSDIRWRRASKLTRFGRRRGLPGSRQRPGDPDAAADRALHAAKALGRDRAVIYSPEVTNVLGAVSRSTQRRDPGAPRHRAQPRGGARPARLRHREAQPDRWRTSAR